MADKKKAAPKKEAAPKEKAAPKASATYCVCVVRPAPGGQSPFKQAGTFSTLEEAEAYVAANPQWPQLQARKA